jgi:hypothetical protein
MDNRKVARVFPASSWKAPSRSASRDPSFLQGPAPLRAPCQTAAMCGPDAAGNPLTAPFHAASDSARSVRPRKRHPRKTPVDFSVRSLAGTAARFAILRVLPFLIQR